MRALINSGRDSADITELTETVLRYPVVPAVKTLIARKTGNAAWTRTAPPLTPLSGDDARALGETLDRILASHEPRSDAT